MQDLRIEVDIYCDWQTEPQAYRLYIDNDLFTERTYIWRNPHQWVREILVAELMPGEHIISVKPAKISNYNMFKLANFAINSKLHPLALLDNNLKFKDSGKFKI